ncbi:Nucleoid-associated protein YgaU, contains BON and LysM domains [Cognatiyoonia koreensis]|uniref:Nucleoid-associated protein YgaU, contains BON and LysM domains n=1 Tax=Cognatiyoonia koreensis TaxID=364200 RepID=A0A1I0RFF5_9RHOB|nr:LysM peptidoglycan-binding domain-containing protein [Cognatiyoonia koreensis]SEW39611.1 Nucleoid-associated protein YgaU, contains BON and LysM domains [Cognatiyoonia koreensis]
MVRVVIGLFIGAVALCGYIIIQQEKRPIASNTLFATQTDVARATSQPLLAEGISGTEALQVAPLEVPTNPTPTPAPIEPSVAAPEVLPTIQTDESTVAMVTANILAGLGVKVDVSDLADQRDMETSDVLASIGVIANARPFEPAPRSPLEIMVVESLQLGLSDAAIDRRVNDAALLQHLTVPEILVTPQGSVDTAALLKSIVTTAQTVASGKAPEVPQVATGDGTGVEVRVVQRATATQEYRFYTVAGGDSLGGISAKFYGDVNKYTIIFEANRGILSSPDQIRVGQRLTIPDLPEV